MLSGERFGVVRDAYERGCGWVPVFELELTTERRAIIAVEMQEAPRAETELRVDGNCGGDVDVDAKATMIQKHFRGWQAYKQVHALIGRRHQHRPEHPNDTCTHAHSAGAGANDSCEYIDPLYCLPARFLDRAYYFIRENQRYVLAMDPEEERHFIDIRENPFEKKLVRPYHISNSDLVLLDTLTENSYFFKKHKRNKIRKLLYGISTFVVIEHPGELLCRYGDVADSFFVVLQGQLDCVVNVHEGAQGSATDIITTQKTKAKKQFSTERAINRLEQKTVIVRGQRLLQKDGKRSRHREIDLDGIIVGTFGAGDSFGETALSGVAQITRRASILSKVCPCVLLRIAAADYVQVKHQIDAMRRRAMERFLSRIDFLSHWESSRIALLAGSCQLVQFHKRDIIQKQGDAIAIWIVYSGAVRVLYKMPKKRWLRQRGEAVGPNDGGAVVIEAQRALRGEILGALETMRHISTTWGMLMASPDFYRTECVKMSLTGFQLIFNDSIAREKLQMLVKYGDFAKYFSTHDKTIQIDHGQHVLKVAVPTAAFTVDHMQQQQWNTFCDNMYHSIPSSVSVTNGGKTAQKETQHYRVAKKYLEQLVGPKAVKGSLHGLRYFMAKRADEKVNNDRKNMYETLAKRHRVVCANPPIMYARKCRDPRSDAVSFDDDSEKAPTPVPVIDIPAEMQHDFVARPPSRPFRSIPADPSPRKRQGSFYAKTKSKLEKQKPTRYTLPPQAVTNPGGRANVRSPNIVFEEWKEDLKTLHAYIRRETANEDAAAVARIVATYAEHEEDDDYDWMDVV